MSINSFCSAIVIFFYLHTTECFIPLWHPTASCDLGCCSVICPSWHISNSKRTLLSPLLRPMGHFHPIITDCVLNTHVQTTMKGFGVTWRTKSVSLFLSLSHMKTLNIRATNTKEEWEWKRASSVISQLSSSRSSSGAWPFHSGWLTHRRYGQKHSLNRGRQRIVDSHREMVCLQKGNIHEIRPTFAC